MKRNATLTEQRPDPTRLAVNLPVGLDGGYFVGESGVYGQDHGPDVANHNTPPDNQPGLWCQWTPGPDGITIEWDGGEKFYNYEEWLTYLVEHFIKPWGYVLNGVVEWQGEDSSDFGQLVVTDNQIESRQGQRTFGPLEAH